MLRTVRMRLSITAISTIAAVACRAPSSAPASPAPPPPFFFIQMSDPQFGFFTANADFAKETANFEKAIGVANRLKPAFVVITGDLTHRVGDTAQIAEFKRIAAKLDKSIRLYNVSGNHDVGQIPTPALLADYRRNYGADRYVFSHGAFTGVVINSTLFKDGTGAPAEAAAQEAWLRGTLDSLKRAGRAQVVIFQHHPWFLVHAEEGDQYYNLPLAKRREMLALFAQFGVTKVFAGHYHRNAFAQVPGGLDMITSGPVGKPQGADSSGFRIVTVAGDKIEHRYYALDSVPATPVPSAAWFRDSSLRVMTFNIAAGNGNLARIAATIREANPDLVALQEVDVNWGARSNFADQAAELGKALGMDARFGEIYRLPLVDSSAGKVAVSTREYGVAFLSRFPILTSRNYIITRLSTQQESPTPTQMPGFLMAVVQVRGGTMRVFNTHTDYRPDPAVRVKQVEEMLSIVGEPRMPTLLFGDLNAPPEAPELRPLLIRLRDAWPTENGEGFTYPATKPVKRIDYVLTSPHFRAVSARVPDSNASDHRPVVVELVRLSKP